MNDFFILELETGIMFNFVNVDKRRTMTSLIKMLKDKDRDLVKRTHTLVFISERIVEKKLSDYYFVKTDEENIETITIPFERYKQFLNGLSLDKIHDFKICSLDNNVVTVDTKTIVKHDTIINTIGYPLIIRYLGKNNKRICIFLYDVKSTYTRVRILSEDTNFICVMKGHDIKKQKGDINV